MSGGDTLQSPGPSRELRQGTKRHAVLRALLDSGDEGLDCFEAVRVAHDFVLRSTVSDIQRGYGISISRRPHIVPNSFGGETHCVRYWIEGAAREHAARLLDLPASATVH
jgi:hypothetical protein